MRGRWDAVTVDARRSARDDRGEDAEDDFGRRRGLFRRRREDAREVEREVEREHSNESPDARPDAPPVPIVVPIPVPVPEARARRRPRREGGGARPGGARGGGRRGSAIMRERRDRDGFDDGDDRARRDARQRWREG